MSVKKLRRELIAFAKDLCDTTETELSARGHLVLRFTGPLGTEIVVQSGTPSDHRSMLNWRAQCRRAAARVGCPRGLPRPSLGDMT